MSTSAAREAEGVRQSYWDGFYPVDPFAIAPKMGISVFVAELPPDISGALFKKPGTDPVILVAQGDSRLRQRFTVAHEIGHYIKRLVDGRSAEEFESIDFRGPLAKSGTDAEERYANAFAAELLMPESALRAMIARGDTFTQIAGFLHVSGEALSHRLRSLKLSV